MVSRLFGLVLTCPPLPFLAVWIHTEALCHAKGPSTERHRYTKQRGASGPSAGSISQAKPVSVPGRRGLHPACALLGSMRERPAGQHPTHCHLGGSPQDL